jgi:hypothetical protein
VSGAVIIGQHRIGKTGAAPFFAIVPPAFAMVVLLLGILPPCVAIFKWLGDSISLFEYFSLLYCSYLAKSKLSLLSAVHKLLSPRQHERKRVPILIVVVEVAYD